MPDNDAGDIKRRQDSPYRSNESHSFCLLSEMARVADLMLAAGDPAAAKKMIDSLYAAADALD